MTKMRDKVIKASFPRDGESDTFNPDTDYKEDIDFEGKFLIKSMSRTLSLWESQLDRLVMLSEGKKGVFKVTWIKEPGSKSVFPQLPNQT